MLIPLSDEQGSALSLLSQKEVEELALEEEAYTEWLGASLDTDNDHLGVGPEHDVDLVSESGVGDDMHWSVW